MLRRLLLAAAGDPGVQRAVSSAPVSRAVVARFVAGEDVGRAVEVTRGLAGEGLLVSLDHLGEDTRDAGQAERQTKNYLALLDRLADEGLTPAAEVSVKLSALGQALDPSLAVDNARTVCDAARSAGTTVTLDMEDSTTTTATLAAHAALRADFPDLGAVVQSYLRRTEADCRALAAAGSRVRLCKGAYAEPPEVAFPDRASVDRSFVRCLRALLDGGAYPMVATHDPRLVAVAGALARRAGRPFEYQMLFGVRPDEQRRLAGTGVPVRVYVPYGRQWYAYLMRRLAERPANVAFFLRALAGRS